MHTRDKSIRRRQRVRRVVPPSGKGEGAREQEQLPVRLLEEGTRRPQLPLRLGARDLRKQEVVGALVELPSLSPRALWARHGVRDGWRHETREMPRERDTKKAKRPTGAPPSGPSRSTIVESVTGPAGPGGRKPRGTKVSPTWKEESKSSVRQACRRRLVCLFNSLLMQESI